MLGCNFCAEDDGEYDEEKDQGVVLNIDTDTLMAMRQSTLNQRLDTAVKSMQRALEVAGFSVSHIKGDQYSIEGRSVRLQLLQNSCEFAHVTEKFGYDAAKRAAAISVVDGPLHQPLLDYLLQTGRNENYDMRGTENPAAVTGVGRQIDFLVENPTKTGNPEEASRIEAMWQATMQADLRQRATGVASFGSIIQAPMRSEQKLCR